MSMDSARREEDGGTREPRKSKSATDDDAGARFPIGQVTTLAICKFSEPIAFNSVIAYTFPMAKYLHDGDGTNASFYAGLLVSAYAFGEVLTSMLWGSLSDRIGRKPIVLLGLGGVAVSCIMFGLAKTYWVALLARLIGGMLNGNVSVMQTMLAEMIKRPEHEPAAYATHPFVWFAGGIIGSAMGGWLAQPAHQYPDSFAQDGIFAEYPYLLPNIVSVVAIVIAIIQGLIFLEETNPMILAKRARARSTSHDTLVNDSDETSPLLGIPKGPTIAVTEPEERTETSVFEDSLPSATDPHFDLRRSSFGTVHSIKLQPERNRSNNNHLPSIPEERPSFHETFNFTVVMLILSFVIVSYHGMAYGNLLPIYIQDEPQATYPDFDLRGGLGFPLHDVGSFMASNGFIAMAVQILIFPPFVAKIGVWKSYVVMMLLYPISYTLIPFLTLLAPGLPRSAGIYGIMIYQNHLNIIIPPCLLILIKNATPSPLVLGTVNGACMALICAARTVAPPLQGLIYAQGGSAAAWFSLVGVAVVAIVQLFWVPRERKVEVESVDGLHVGGGHSTDERETEQQQQMREAGDDEA